MNDQTLHILRGQNDSMTKQLVNMNVLAGNIRVVIQKAKDTASKKEFVPQPAQSDFMLAPSTNVVQP